jgi:hypothetical protein
VTACSRIDRSGVYELASNLTATGSGVCLEVNASDVVVDGNGSAIELDGSVTAVETVQAGLSNVTVRNLTVVGTGGSERAVNLDDTTDPRILGLRTRAVFVSVEISDTTDAVVRDAVLDATYGIDGQRATAPTIRNVEVAGDGYAVSVPFSENATVTGIETSGNQLRALDLGGTANGTVRAVAITGARTGIDGTDATGLRVRNATVTDTETAVTFRGDGEETAAVDDATVRNLTAAAVPSGPDVTFVTVDGSNDVRVRNLTAPNASFETFTGANVSLGPAESTPTPPQDVPIGRLNVTDVGPNASATVGLAYDEPAVNESTVAAYRVTGGAWTELTGNASVDGTNDTVTLSGVAPGTYGAFAAPNATTPGNGSDGDGNATGPLGERLFPTGIPGGTSDRPPTDVDGDGLLEDLDGDGTFGFVDVIEFVFALQRGDYSTGALSTEQLTALDFDGSDRIDFVDVIELVFRL